ncbi:MAG: xanthine dehydrogenase family protein subunit M [Planctomycetota bacterium]|nr:xanthine dehydrogenase family protein subunit M [Planctomycetota bacterium]
MRAFEHVEPHSLENAISFLTDDREEAVVMAGGTDLITEMRDRIAVPDRVVNLKSISGLDTLAFEPGKGLTIGPLVTLARLDKDPTVREKYGCLAEGASAAASPQIRNQGTIGGNLCQRPRCPYYRDPELYCFKRGGGICYAEKGDNRYHSLFGGGPSHIVHPSDTAPPLVALRAILQIVGPEGKRGVAIGDFFTLPEVDPMRENILEPNEVVAEIRLDDPPAGLRSAYIKATQRGSWDFALVSAACVLDFEGGVCSNARIVLGGVAPIPWRVEKAEGALVGKRIDEKSAAEAAELAFEGAKPMSGNRYKIPLGKAIVKRTILRCAPQ